MNEYNTVNILDLIEAVGEDEVKRILSDFFCEKNTEIESFIKKSAIDFAKRKISVTHLLLDENGELEAIFTLSHKAIQVRDDILSSDLRKKIKRYAQIDEDTNCYTLSAFLIAQFGKNFANNNNSKIDGNLLMASSLKVLRTVQHEVGGGVVYLECEDKPKLLAFYQNDMNRFRIFDERISESDDTKYIQLLRLF